MREYYSTKDAADLTGASRQIIRIYTDKYSKWFSTEATPGPGQVRRYTPSDLKLIAFIYSRTNDQGLTHDTVFEQLGSGELERFPWSLETPQDSTDTPEGGTGALVPMESLQAAHALLQDAQRREQTAQDTLDAMRERMETLQRELGQAQGELSAYRRLQARRPAWWVKLFGGRNE